MDQPFSKTKYHLHSLTAKKNFEDSGWILDDPLNSTPSLVQSVYDKKQLDYSRDHHGIYKFSDWLPVSRMLAGSFAPMTYQSKGLADHLGLKKLYITFSGYWPEKGIKMKTCSFKETEAYSVCGRLNPDEKKILVVASAGNTARAFAQVCSDNQIPLLLSVPEDNLDALWFDAPLHDCVKLIASASGCDYFDAIHLSNIAVKHPSFIPEGGAKNVARRDGMATTVLSAATFIGRIPEYYFQAVGSGTGAIAAWEANKRLIEDGRFGNHKMRLMVSQNLPFKPIHDAWVAGSRDLLPFDDRLARKDVEEILAKVLSNRRPPYSLAGGLFDALLDAEGEVLLATNQEAVQAGELFLKNEGIDIHPAAAIATATLIQAVEENKVQADSIIMLNITGGGEDRFKADYKLHYLKPALIFDQDPDEKEVLEKIDQLFS